MSLIAYNCETPPGYSGCRESVVMKSLIKTSVIVASVVVLSACNMNSFTVGSDNMQGLELAVDCKTDAAISSLAQAQTSEVAGYRRISYALSMAVQEEAGLEVQKQATYAKFAADSVIEDKSEKQFLYEVSCFRDYLKALRLDVYGTEQCSEITQ